MHVCTWNGLRSVVLMPKISCRRFGIRIVSGNDRSTSANFLPSTSRSTQPASPMAVAERGARRSTASSPKEEKGTSIRARLVPMMSVERSCGARRPPLALRAARSLSCMMPSRTVPAKSEMESRAPRETRRRMRLTLGLSRFEGVAPSPGPPSEACCSASSAAASSVLLTWRSTAPASTTYMASPTAPCEKSSERRSKLRVITTSLARRLTAPSGREANHETW
mmetsp:Transcript_6363/g.22391  ORF Transcript_6363/g.22391 Transcript_6363/m.22391 type:complete len:223 (-) Transcript_6363:1218-1886(-)